MHIGGDLYDVSHEIRQLFVDINLLLIPLYLVLQGLQLEIRPLQLTLQHDEKGFQDQTGSKQKPRKLKGKRETLNSGREIEQMVVGGVRV